jgi:addiction module HigA family antidote
MTELEARKLLLPCPGDTIQEIIDDRGMSQKELAHRLQKNIATINEIIKGKTAITEETALSLEKALHVPARFWLNLERRYQEEKLEISRLEKLQENQEWA